MLVQYICLQGPQQHNALLTSGMNALYTNICPTFISYLQYYQVQPHDLTPK